MKLFKKIKHFFKLAPTSNRIAIKKIEDLTSKLKNLPFVERVKLVYNIPDDLHEIDFHLFISNEVNEPDTLWELAEWIAMQCHRELRQITGEKWYFHTDVILQSNVGDEEPSGVLCGSLKPDGMTPQERYEWFKNRKYYKTREKLPKDKDVLKD